MKKIVVQLDNSAWTTRAMHFACSMARQTGGEIVLLQLIEVNNMGSLGAGFDNVPVGCDSYKLAESCAQIAEQYNVLVELERMEYSTRTDALAQAVEQLEATILFAPMPHSRYSVVNKLNSWMLTHQLHHCHLYTLAGNDAPNEVAPALSMDMPRHVSA